MALALTCTKHTSDGPGWLIPTELRDRTTSDGKTPTTRWLFPFRLDDEQAGIDSVHVARWLVWVT